MSLGFWLPNAERAHLLVEMAALESEVGCRLGHVPIAVPERPGDQVALDGLEHLRHGAALDPGAVEGLATEVLA